MANVRFNNKEKNDIEILKCLLQLSKSWENELTVINVNKREQLIRSCIPVLNRIVLNSNLTEEEVRIINDTLINKHETMERIGRKYFYSDSGLRNKLNLILKKLLNQIENDM